ncbi:MAG: ATP-binding protein [Bacteroidota bacterium]
MKFEVRHKITFLLGLLLAANCGAQKILLNQIDSLIGSKKLDEANELLIQIDTTDLTESEMAYYQALSGRYYTLNNQDDLSFQNLMSARRRFLALDSISQVAEINLEIIQLVLATENKSLDYQPYLDDYVNYAIAQDSPKLITRAYMQLGNAFISSEPLKSLDYFKSAQHHNQFTADTVMKAKIHHSLGVVYAERTQHLDSALYHYDIALEIYQDENLVDYISYIYNNKATVFKKQGDYSRAIQNYLKADSLPITEYYKNNKKLLYGFISDAYEKNGDYRNAVDYLKLHLAYNDSVNEDVQNTAMYDIQTKYEVEKKENENLKLKNNRIWLSIALMALFLLFIISYLAYKNQRSKKIIAEADKEIERQKVEKLLKDQELNGIDAMIRGQEKERARIANDLHDNLGSILATIKLHFQNLKIRKERLKQQEKLLLEKTDSLIEEAYQSVRNLAHVKNAGVKSKEGLLPAIKNFASKASLANELVIEVEDHGMDERLENSLEITIFRIVQELITNVIKHAKAKECTIHLTQYQENINLMVEDNGIGFNTDQKKVHGMGLYSIQKRVENLGGKVTVESILGKGTTVIIDIVTA